MEAQELQRIKNKYDIIGNDPALIRAIETAMAIAPTDLTVLITGESGVGKETIPKIIHQHSLRKNGKFFAVNCGAIPEGTINSELFGHEKGSFTGATTERKGYFEEANGGTLFLDEIGELPLTTQAMLLRVLQNGEFMKVGSSKVEKTNVRIVAATNVNLFHAVSKGKFREDLYYRLNAIQVNMPALRDRKDDIYLLFRKFTSDFSEKYSMRKISLTHDAILMLRNYRWPGNIRQLKNITEKLTAMESMKISSSGERLEIDAKTLSAYIPKESDTVLPSTLDNKGTESIGGLDMQMIVKILIDIKQEIDKLKAVVYSDDFKTERPTKQLPQREAEPSQEAEWQEAGEPAENEVPETLSIHKLEEEKIIKALEIYNGNRKQAAKALGMSERTLYRRLEKLGIE